MAPPAVSPSEPISQRLLALAQTLQFSWFAANVTVLLCTFRYALSYITFNYYSTWAILSYRTCFIAAAATYGIVVFKGYRSKLRTARSPQQGVITLALDENVQYLAMSLLWLFTAQMPIAILPFAIYSLFHVAQYTRGTFLPVVFPPGPGSPPGAKTSNAGLADNIGRFSKDYYDASMSIVALLEIFILFRLVGSALIFVKYSWIRLTFYAIFLRVRYSLSSFVQSAVAQLVARADTAISNQSTPPAVRNIWEQVKGVSRQVAAATDVNRFVKPATPKKAQ